MAEPGPIDFARSLEKHIRHKKNPIINYNYGKEKTERKFKYMVSEKSHRFSA
jgi:hypothetical protein